MGDPVSPRVGPVRWPANAISKRFLYRLASMADHPTLCSLRRALEHVQGSPIQAGIPD